MNYTDNLGLKKPESTDFYNVGDFNDNADQIDAEFAKKGQPNGYAELDGSGRIPYSQLPESAMEYKGTWNAATNTPTLAQGVGTNGDMYIVSTGGTRFSITWAEGDRAIFDGTTQTWQRIAGSAVMSVAGKTGAVTLVKADITDFPTSMTPTSHSHSASDITSGTLSVARGGTGKTSVSDTAYTTLNYRGESLNSGDTTPASNGCIAWKYA